MQNYTRTGLKTSGRTKYSYTVMNPNLNISVQVVSSIYGGGWERSNCEFLQSSVKHVGGYVMVWDCDVGNHVKTDELLLTYLTNCAVLSGTCLIGSFLA